jgi:hypothetical protein
MLAQTQPLLLLAHAYIPAIWETCRVAKSWPVSPDALFNFKAMGWPFIIFKMLNPPRPSRINTVSVWIPCLSLRPKLVIWLNRPILLLLNIRLFEELESGSRAAASFCAFSAGIPNAPSSASGLLSSHCFLICGTRKCVFGESYIGRTFLSSLFLDANASFDVTSWP